MNFLIFILSTIGLTLIINNSYFFKSIREKINGISPIMGKMIKCSQCTGFWTALLIQFIILVNERGSFMFFWSDFYYIIYGFIGSFVCYSTYLLLKPLMNKYD